MKPRRLIQAHEIDELRDEDRPDLAERLGLHQPSPVDTDDEGATFRAVARAAQRSLLVDPHEELLGSGGALQWDEALCRAVVIITVAAIIGWASTL